MVIDTCNLCTFCIKRVHFMFICKCIYHYGGHYRSCAVTLCLYVFAKCCVPLKIKYLLTLLNIARTQTGRSPQAIQKQALLIYVQYYQDTNWSQSTSYANAVNYMFTITRTQTGRNTQAIHLQELLNMFNIIRTQTGVVP